METLRNFAFGISIFLLACSFLIHQPNQTDNRIDKKDSLIVSKYVYQLKKEYVADDSLTVQQLDSLFYESRNQIPAKHLVYAPDSTFKIITIELESCGAYCNSMWYSWIYFNLKEKEKIKSVDITEIEAIYALPDSKYLIVEKSWGRPASVYTVYCLAAQLVSFTSDSMTIHPIQYYHQNYFSFCQENGVQSEREPFIKYDKDKRLLSYYYGNNYAYSQGIDTDTLREGQFKYVNGSFVLDKETITERPPTVYEK